MGSTEIILSFLVFEFFSFPLPLHNSLGKNVGEGFAPVQDAFLPLLYGCRGAGPVLVGSQQW